MESIELCQCFASLGDSKNAHLACYYRSTEYDSGIILSYDENEAVTGETGQRTKLGGVFLRKLKRAGFSAQHRLACQFMIVEKETVKYVQRS